jgi:uncharacterized protein YjbI with pentapeptide repeats
MLYLDRYYRGVGMEEQMANPDQVKMLKRSVEEWNRWREDNPDVEPDLRGADLNRADLTHIDLSNSDLGDADLTCVDFFNAKLFNADLFNADLSDADFTNANLRGANLSGAKLHKTILNGANLSKANISGASLIETNLENADISSCCIYGICTWELKTENLKQSNLIITRRDEPEITVDNLEIAQFVYMLLNNTKIRDVISTIANKAVLILGRFNLPERKAILDGLRDKLREKGFVPIVFDFERAAERDFIETIKVLAGMSLFVIADVTDPKSTPMELQGTVPDYMIPFVPIIQKDEKPFAMFADLGKYPWMMELRSYENKDQLINLLEAAIINPALEKHRELIVVKNRLLKTIDLSDFEPPTNLTS